MALLEIIMGNDSEQGLASIVSSIMATYMATLIVKYSIYKAAMYNFYHFLA